MDLDKLFIDLMHYLARTGIAKSNMYKIFVNEEFLAFALLSSKLVTREELITNKNSIKETLIDKWQEIKDNL